MAQRYEYLIVHVQQDRVTFVNHQWQGEIGMDIGSPELSLASCPYAWQFLDQAGEDGWDLTTALPQTSVTGQQAYMMFLKRPLEAELEAVPEA